LSKESSETIAVILQYLNKVKTRCTYGVIAQIIGVNTQSVGRLLGERRPEASWVVSEKTKEPTGYLDEEKHPDLYRTKRIIKSAEVIRRNLGI
jgi:hypothetical protein